MPIRVAFVAKVAIRIVVDDVATGVVVGAALVCRIVVIGAVTTVMMKMAVATRIDVVVIVVVLVAAVVAVAVDVRRRAARVVQTAELLVGCGQR